MSLLKIVIYPSQILTQKSEKVTEFGPSAQRLFDDMIETMYVEDGVGLAAPQVGVLKRILVACPTVKKNDEIVIVNPQILDSSGREAAPEGCLSFPGITADVARAKKIRLRFQDRLGQKKETELQDFFARVVQHEIDHLEGILLIDRVSFDQRHEILTSYQSA